MIQSGVFSFVPLASPTEIVAQVVEVVQNLFSDAESEGCVQARFLLGG